MNEEIQKTLPILYTVEDIQHIFKCGQKKAYSIMKIKGFPSFKISGKMYVEKSALEEWFKNAQSYKVDTKNKNKVF